MFDFGCLGICPSFALGVAFLLALFVFFAHLQKQNKHSVVCGFGHPLLDMQCTVPVVFLSKYDLKPGDTILAEEKHKDLCHDLCKRPDVEYYAGGATLNAIRVCGWMLSTSNGESPAFVGCIGKDGFGDILKANCGGVRPFFEESEEHPTGTCSCCIAARDRALVANLGAARHFHSEYLYSDKLVSLLDTVNIFYMAGFFLNLIEPTNGHPFPALIVAQTALKKNKIFCMNLSAPYLATAYKKEWKMLLPYIDYLFGNEQDFMALSKAFDWDLSSVRHIVKKATNWEKNSKRPRVVVCTRGSSPAVVCDGAHPTSTIDFKTPSLRAHHIKDLNGAGDAFVGGFLSQLAKGRPTAECMRAGQYTACQIIKQNGCTMPKERPNFNYSIFQQTLDKISTWYQR
eukprot:TRINITY_DN104112_c0_g1_i1.p1 TRINITY_DN104112_c0_g1~~TRINITY_DN104112_c0_g1_i1.p1  ORF type:complete len:400 (-),score=14.06 TRINITY_DN104112_c0_g1_i1:225-1424(-)